MAAPVEIELKYALTEKDYRRIRRRIRGTTRRFTNFYFDTPSEQLRRRGIGCRIRLRGDEAIVTVKYGGSSRGGLHVRTEWESRLNAGLARRILRGSLPLSAARDRAPVKRLRSILGERALLRIHLLGGLGTARTTFPLGPFHGELDRCRIGRRRPFHELEVESPRPKQADAFTRAWLRDLGIPVRPERRTKLGRFFAAIQKGH